MANKIFKYQVISYHAIHVINLPNTHNIRNIDFQGQDLMVWAEVNPTDEEFCRVVHVVPTGGSIPTQKTDFLGTVFTENGLVFHVYLGGLKA